MGSYGNCVYRRASGIYCVRIHVPHDLRHYVGSRELHRSTNLSKRTAALSVAGAVATAWRHCFEVLGQLKALSAQVAAVEFAGDGVVPLATAAEKLSVQPERLLFQLQRPGLRLFAMLAPRAATLVLGHKVADCRDEDRYDVAAVETHGSMIQVSGLVEFSAEAVSLAAFLSTSPVGSRTEVFLGAAIERPEGTVFFHPERLSVGISDLCVRAKDVASIAIDTARLQAALAVAVGQGAAAQPVTPLGLQTHQNGPSAAQFDQGMGQHTSTHSGALERALPKRSPTTVRRRISDLISLFLEDGAKPQLKSGAPRWRPDEQLRNRRKLLPFVELMDDPCVDDLDDQAMAKGLVGRYFDELMRLPTGPDMAKARRELGVQASSKELIAWADSRAVKERMSRKTALSYLAKLSEFFKWAMEEGHPLRFNPAVRMLKGGVARKVRPDEERESFEVEELGRIFSVNWFRDGADLNPNGRPNAHWRPYYYWLPLLGLYTGARLNEICQLDLSDVKSDNGVAFIEISVSDSGDGAESSTEEQVEISRKKLKTVSAKRKIPIHPELLRLGLVDYVESLRGAGHNRLFPELIHHSVKGYAKYAGSWFNERFLGRKLAFPRDSSKTFHSFRHTFVTALGKTNIPTRVKNQLIGHARGVHLAEVRYESDRPPSDMIQFVAQIDYDLPVIAPFRCDMGIICLRAAMRRKKATSSSE